MLWHELNEVAFGVLTLAFALAHNELKPTGLRGTTPVWQLSRAQALGVGTSLEPVIDQLDERGVLALAHDVLEVAACCRRPRIHGDEQRVHPIRKSEFLLQPRQRHECRTNVALLGAAIVGVVYAIDLRINRGRSGKADTTGVPGDIL